MSGRDVRSSCEAGEGAQIVGRVEDYRGVLLGVDELEYVSIAGQRRVEERTAMEKIFIVTTCSRNVIRGRRCVASLGSRLP